MNRIVKIILVIALSSLILIGCKSKEADATTMFCSECFSESTVSKYCPECGVEAKWLIEKPKDVQESKESEVEEKKVEEFIINAENLFNEEKYDQAKTYLNENVISEEGLEVKNKYTTEEQKKKALELYKKCNDKIAEKKANDEKQEENIKKPETQNEKAENVKKEDESGSTKPKAQEKQGICFICNKKDSVSNLNEVRGFGLVHKSCYNNAPVCSMCHETKLIMNEDSNGNGICDYRCDALCSNCRTKEANPSGLCNDCEWNKHYANKATCGGCIGGIVDGSLAGTICPECGNKYELIELK